MLVWGQRGLPGPSREEGNRLNRHDDRLVSIGELFSRAWAIFRRRWLTLLGTVLLGITFMALSIGLPSAAGVMLGMPAIGALASLILGFIATFSYAAAFMLAIADEELGVLAAYRKSLGNILSFAWLSSVLAFVLAGGFMLLIIPGIVFSIWFCLSVFIMLVEDERGMGAMLKSKAYVKGHGWAMFMRLFLLFFFIPLILNLAVSFLGGFIGELTGSSIIAVVVTAVFAVPSLLFPIFAMIALYLIYDDLRVHRKDIVFKPTVGQKARWLTAALAGWLMPFVLLASMQVTMFKELLNLKRFFSGLDLGGIQVETEKKGTLPRTATTARRPAKAGKPAPPGMVNIKGGCFKMGDFTGMGDSDERPAHKVCLSDYWLDATEVTQRAYQRVSGHNPPRFPGADKPVTGITWKQAQAYCARLHKRLPTEAEWEFAARGRGENTRWAGASSANLLSNYAWHARRYDEGPHVVAQKKPNALGLYDMTGNVWEMVADYYSSRYYAHSPVRNPAGPETGDARVMRGGAWFTRPPRELRTTVRYLTRENRADDSIGFRCARSKE